MYQTLNFWLELAEVCILVCHFLYSHQDLNCGIHMFHKNKASPLIR